MILTFIGDIHGRFKYYQELIQYHDGPTIQVGDLGIGFFGYPYPEKFEGNHWFIRGNHDNPELCRKHPNHLGDYGFKKEWNTFYIGGAESIDKAARTIGVDWWEDEEIDYLTFRDIIIPLYAEIRPRIMVTHDCPVAVKDEYHTKFSNGWLPTTCRTQRAFQEMFEIHQPDLWVFGHHHHRATIRMDGTRFECIEPYGILEVETKD